MNQKQEEYILSHFLHHETKKRTLIKFVLLALVVFGYFIFMVLKFGAKDGFYVTALTWSFFVFCTPIADAGFILAFPIRLLFKIRMATTQLASFVIAFFINLYAFFFSPEIYNKTMILSLFRHIISHPFPFWLIILLSIIGTMFSIYFGDELIDVSKHSERKKYHTHKTKYRIIIAIFVVVATIILYDFLLENLRVNIPLGL